MDDSDTEPDYNEEEEEKRWRLDALRDGKKKFNNQLKQVEEAVKDTNDFKQCVDNTSSILREMNALGVEVGWDAECMAIWMKVVAVRKECTIKKWTNGKNEKVEEKSKGGKRKKKRKTRRRIKKRKSKKRRPKRKHKRKTRRKIFKVF